ncbi:hypothetical protein K438DRAFT_1773922 [Mycena galopus ATCC 62051]|nr:hypothetical protein K438DRAFT_1773922 [Mycena galopus ATCC 62051]
MCDTVSASIIFGAPSLIPQNRYIVWGLVSTSGIIYAANQQCPSIKLGRVEAAIKSVEETLKHVKENCVGNHIELVHLTSRLFKAKLSASKIQTRMLETQSVTTYKEFVQYLQALFEIMRDINQCAKKVEAIRTSTLRIIEAERQRQFSAGIEESREIMDRITTSSLARLTSSRRDHHESTITRNTSYESMPWTRHPEILFHITEQIDTATFWSCPQSRRNPRYLGSQRTVKRTVNQFLDRLPPRKLLGYTITSAVDAGFEKQLGLQTRESVSG